MAPWGVAQTLVRYFDLAGVVDDDPIVTQPAADALGSLVTGFGGEILINAWEVDATGKKVTPTPGLELTIGVVTLSKVETDRPTPGATKVTNELWGRGPLATLVEPGEWLVQPELGEVVGFSVVVTAKAFAPAGRFLAIWATRGPRL